MAQDLNEAWPLQFGSPGILTTEGVQAWYNQALTEAAVYSQRLQELESAEATNKHSQQKSKLESYRNFEQVKD